MSLPIDPLKSATLPAPSSATGGKKNIILIITDQQRTTQWFPPHWEQTHLRAMTFLKKHGITFNESVCNTCACTPSRTTIFTGTYPTRNWSNFTLTEFYQPTRGTTAAPKNIPMYEVPPGQLPPGPFPQTISSSENELDQTLPNLATILAEAGYETFYKGKFHLSKGVLGYDNNYYSADITRYGFHQWDPPDAGQDAQIENYGGGTADNDSRYLSDAVAFLKERRDHPEKYPKPFCLIVSLINPHDVLGYPMNWNGPIDNGGYTKDDLKGHIQTPATETENLQTNYKPTCQNQWLKLMNSQGALTCDQPTHYINFYGNLLQKVDEQIMQLLDVLIAPEGSALWRNSMIIRTSDHGEMGLTHGGQRQKWFNVYEESIKVPLVWSNPELFPQKVESNALVSLVDLLPTLAAFCGVPDPGRFEMQGVDYSSLFTHPNGRVQDYTYFINTDIKAGQGIPEAAFPPNNIAMVRDARYKYAQYYGGVDPSQPVPKQEEFYNLAVDVDASTGKPLELHNKSQWAVDKGAPWTITDGEKQARGELQTLLDRSLNGGVLKHQARIISPTPMRPRAKTVVSAWGPELVKGHTAEVYQVIIYSQSGYTYTLESSNHGVWSEVPDTTHSADTLGSIPTTLPGNGGPLLFQPQPKQATRPTYRVARTGPQGDVTHESVVWEDYTQA